MNTLRELNEQQIHVKIRGKYVDGYVLTAYTPEGKGIRVYPREGDPFEPYCWHDVEVYTRDVILEGFDHQYISICGDPLDETPHGSLCVYGELRPLQTWCGWIGTYLDSIPNIEGHYGERVKAVKQRLGEAYVVCVEDTNGITIPGGKRMLGETSGQCALREFREETGLTVEVDLDEYVDVPGKMRIYFVEVVHKPKDKIYVD